MGTAGNGLGTGTVGWEREQQNGNRLGMGWELKLPHGNGNTRIRLENREIRLGTGRERPRKGNSGMRMETAGLGWESDWEWTGIHPGMGWEQKQWDGNRNSGIWMGIKLGIFPQGSPVILGMPSRRGTGSRTMIPRSVPTQSEPWHSRRLVTRTSFCPAMGKVGKAGIRENPTAQRPPSHGVSTGNGLRKIPADPHPEGSTGNRKELEEGKEKVGEKRDSNMK